MSDADQRSPYPTSDPQHSATLAEASKRNSVLFRWKAYGQIDRREALDGIDKEILWELLGHVSAPNDEAALALVSEQLFEMGLTEDGIDLDERTT